MLSNFQVKDVFLPWYNAYRFFVQNAKRLEVEGLAVFSPIDQGSLLKSSNVLDHWINSATESLVSFVRQEMDAYRLYTVECSTFFFGYLFPFKIRCVNDRLI
jgi:isoleucyl-tRNA synthetase